MSFFDSISIKARFLYLFAVIVVFVLISGLALLHTMNSINELRDLENEFDSYFNVVHTIDHQLIDLRYALSDSNGNAEEASRALEQSFSVFRTGLGELSAKEVVRSDPHTETIIAGLFKYINALEGVVKEQDVSGGENFPDIETIHEAFIDPIIEGRIRIRQAIYEVSFRQQGRYSLNLFIILFLGMLFTVMIIVLNEISNYRNIRKLLIFTIDLEKGNRREKTELSGAREFLEISHHLNSFLDGQVQKVNYLKSIVEGNAQVDFEAGSEDILGNEIRVLAEHLRTIQAEEKQRYSEEQKQAWTSTGIAQFAEILRSERENSRELSFLVIRKLVTYLGVEMGTIFLTSDTVGDRDHLETVAAYAYDRRKYVNKTFAFGEGLPGTCALEKEKIYIDDIPEEYSDIISGVGQTRPRYVLLVPMKIREEIFGVLELASFRKLEAHELDFVDRLAESIATTLSAVKTNEQTAALLRQSQEQAEKLMEQEEVMKINMLQLEKAQVESLKKESEITGILNAMNESSLVAEFSLNGRFTHVNEKFLELLESPREVLLGKHHNEFAIVDRYSEEYKKFWQDLKAGKIISREEHFRLFSGKEIWLQQTFTPIRNQEGEIFKILNIAVNITQAKLQQKNLEEQASEITRQNLEMESLNEAVNSSIIKAELDHEGIILDINRNFTGATGLNRKEILGRNNKLFLKDIEKEQFDRIWQEVLKGKTWEGATRRTKPTGEEVWLMSTFSPVKNEEGMIYKIYFLALDITEKKLKYQLLEEANREIERLKKSSS